MRMRSNIFACVMCTLVTTLDEESIAFLNCGSSLGYKCVLTD